MLGTSLISSVYSSGIEFPRCMKVNTYISGVSGRVRRILKQVLLDYHFNVSCHMAI